MHRSRATNHFLRPSDANRCINTRRIWPIGHPLLTLALLARIAVPPILVALMSLAARRWGPTIGGLIMGLPWMTGPVLFFLTMDKGTDFAVRACTGIELAVWSMGAFMLAFGFVSRVAPWPICLLAAIIGYFGTAYFTQGLDIPLWAAIAGAVVTLLMTIALLPKPTTNAYPGRLPWWDIPARMVATFILVAGIVLSADVLGPQRSGIIASYPVIMTVIGAFTMHQWGSDAILRVLLGMSKSLLGFVAFFTVIGYTLPALGLVPSFLVAGAAALSVSFCLISWNAWTTRKLRRQADNARA